MKQAFSIILLLLTGFTGSAQLMRTAYDAKLLKDNDSLFIGKPLQTLLQEIGPTIKMVFTDSHRPHNALSLLIFKFIDKDIQPKYDRAGKRSLSLLVYVKENFDWDKSSASKTQWTAEDAVRLGHLTIYRIAIVGEHLDDDPPVLYTHFPPGLIIP